MPSTPAHYTSAPLPPAPSRILVRAANWVGDAVMTLPVLEGLRRGFPMARIILLAKPWVAPLFDNHPAVDEIMLYERPGRHTGAAGMLRLVRELRQAKFDLALLLQNAFEAAWIAFLAGIPRRLGFATDGRGLLLTHPVPVPANYLTLHQIEYYRALITRGLGVPAGRHLHLPIAPRQRVQALKRLQQLGYQDRHPLVGLNPGAAFGSAKRWPVASFAELGHRLARDRQMCFLIFGGPGEAALGDQLAGALPAPAINLSGRTDLQEAMALLSLCRLLITNDSGLMHVAAALAVPLVAIFGPTDHRRTSPAGFNSVMVRVDTPCSPCLKPECPLQHHQCMRRVTPSVVYEECLKWIPSSLQP